jgi:hypothetical protein
MQFIYRAAAVGLITFGASVIGMLVQWAVPADQLTAARGSVGAMVGLVGLLLALVLGLLIWTAFAVFTTQQAEAFSLGPVIAEIDLALEKYGPDAAGGRAGLRAAVQRARQRFFGSIHEDPRPFNFEEMKATMNGLNGYFANLAPATDEQRRLQTAAWDQARKMQDTLMLMARQLANPFPPHVLTIVLCWASALFFGNGVVATPNAVTVIAHLAGAISISTAVFLILELSHPYTGVIRLTPAGIDHVISALGQTPASN